jgi:hypothetical protein
MNLKGQMNKSSYSLNYSILKILLILIFFLKSFGISEAQKLKPDSAYKINGVTHFIYNGSIYDSSTYNFIVTTDSLIKFFISSQKQDDWLDSSSYIIVVKYYIDYFNQSNTMSDTCPYPYYFYELYERSSTFTTLEVKSIEFYLRGNNEFIMAEKDYIKAKYLIQEKFGGMNPVEFIEVRKNSY